MTDYESMNLSDVLAYMEDRGKRWRGEQTSDGNSRARGVEECAHVLRRWLIANTESKSVDEEPAAWAAVRHAPGNPRHGTIIAWGSRNYAEAWADGNHRVRPIYFHPPRDTEYQSVDEDPRAELEKARRKLAYLRTYVIDLAGCTAGHIRSGAQRALATCDGMGSDTEHQSKYQLPEPELAHARIDPADISMRLRGFIATGDSELLAIGAENIAQRMDEIAEVRSRATECKPVAQANSALDEINRLCRSALDGHNVDWDYALNRIAGIASRAMYTECRSVSLKYEDADWIRRALGSMAKHPMTETESADRARLLAGELERQLRTIDCGSGDGGCGGE